MINMINRASTTRYVTNFNNTLSSLKFALKRILEYTALAAQGLRLIFSVQIMFITVEP